MPRTWVLSGMLLTLLLACSESQNSLDKKAAEGRYDEIAAFIEANVLDSASGALVASAMAHVLDRRNRDSIGIVKSIAILTSNETARIASQLLPLIVTKCPMQIDSIFLGSIEDCAAREDYTSLTRLGKEYCSLKTNRMTIIANALEIGQEIVAAQVRKSDALSIVPRLESELESRKAEPIKTQNLEAFMVADVGFSGYEIALAQYTYLGRVPSEKHAVLFTKNTTFTSKGWFTLRVRRLPDSEVRLKEEYGSFNQTWPVYEEVTEEELRINEATMRELGSKRDSVHWARNLATEEVLGIAKMKKELQRILDRSDNVRG